MADKKPPFTEEMKKKLRDDFNRRPFIDEHKRKIAEIQKRRPKGPNSSTTVHLSDEN